MKTHYALMISLLLTATACEGANGIKAQDGLKPDPVVSMLHEGVIELNGNIEELQHHIDDLKQMPIDSDPQVQ